MYFTNSSDAPGLSRRGLRTLFSGWRGLSLGAMLVVVLAAAAFLANPPSGQAAETVNAEAGTTRMGDECQYTMLLHKPLSQDRIDAMVQTVSLINDEVFTRDYGDTGFAISTPMGTCLDSGGGSAAGIAQGAQGTNAGVQLVGYYGAAQTGVQGSINLALSKTWKIYLGIIASAVVGGATAVAVGLLLPEIAVAIGLSMSGTAAAVVGACIGGITGNLTYQIINGNKDGTSLTVSSVLSCITSSTVAGISAWVSSNRQAVNQLVTDALAQSGSNVASEGEMSLSSVYSSARSNWSITGDIVEQSTVVQTAVDTTGHAVQ